MTTRTLSIPATLVLSLGLAFGAAAQVPAQPPDAVRADDRSQAHAVESNGRVLEPAEQAVRQQDEGIAGDRHCLRETGSRIVRADRKGRECVSASGRSYSREELEQTGMTHDLGAALRMLDTSIR